MLSLRLQSPYLCPKNHDFTRWNPRIRDELLLRKRRRRRRLDVRVRSAFDEIFGNFVSAFPSPVSLDLLLAPVVGFASSAAAMYLSSRARERLSGGDDGSVSGDWILFTSPTPFNRCVLLRCSSVSFEDGGELLDGVNERLITEERHYVNLSRGRIPAAGSKGEGSGVVEEISYQRICVRTDDGGVISLDWPENLELGKEHGLDTTVLIVPGTAEGSMDKNVKFFVYDALKHGYFPIVMNPRGCAGSPLTTARLFTAADSDDICTAIEFISRLRPWTTFMSVGWGYGANMLTKYLAEVGESTPFTAAVCIDNPFDLSEATTSAPYHIALDQKLKSGLIDILQANKELFQGKTKGFDVGKALSATSLREFDQAISMVSYGCDVIDDFYSKISTMRSIGNLKVPILFIQSDDGTVPLFSVPRSSIADNPFTSLLLCSCRPSSVLTRDSSAILWCQHIAIEWLSAVELALLKGRHPLLKDVDVTINPTRGLTFVDGRLSGRSFTENNKVPGSYHPAKLFLRQNDVNGNSIMKLTQSNPANGFLIDPSNNGFMTGEAAVQGNNNLNLRSEMHKLDAKDNERTTDEKNIHEYQQNNSGNTADMSGVDGEGSKVLQSASVAMNMLDFTMPGALDEEQKKKVLTAVGQGETLMKALEGAVPEDVRGKLTNAVSEVLQTQGANLNLEGFKGIANVSSEIKSRIQDNIKEKSKIEGGYSENHSSGATHDEKMEVDTTHLNSSDNITPEIVVPSDQRTAQAPEFAEAGSEMRSKSNEVNSSEKLSGVLDESGDRHKVSQNYGTAERLTADGQEALNQQNFIASSEGRERDIDEPNIPTSYGLSGELPAADSLTFDHNATEKEGNEIEKNENKVTQNIDQNLNSSSAKPEKSSTLHPTKSPSISVTEALDVLTGFDDSTQMAVNSVFGVLENMIDQLEKSSIEDSNGVVHETENHESHVLCSETLSANENKPESVKCPSKDSNTVQKANQPLKREKESASEKASQNVEVVKIELGQNEVNNSLKSTREQNWPFRESIMGLDKPELKNNAILGAQQNLPLDIATNPYFWGSPYSAYLQSYLSTKLQRTKTADLELATDLFLDPEEGHWKMMDRASNSNTVVDGGQNQIVNDNTKNSQDLAPLSGVGKIIEPPYVVLDTEMPKAGEQSNGKISANGSWDSEEEIKFLVKKSLLESLQLEVGRRLGMSNLLEIEVGLMDDLEQIADAVSQASLLDCQLNLESLSGHSTSSKLGTIEGQDVIETISAAVQDASHLKKVLPVGVIVGSVLSSLGKYFHIANTRDDDQSRAIQRSRSIQEKLLVEGSDAGDRFNMNEKIQHSDANSPVEQNSNTTLNFGNDGVMVGAVTAALGASALLAHHQQRKIGDGEGTEVPSTARNWKGLSHEGHAKHEETMQDKNQNSIMSSLAEKAMSVAGPVVPTKGDGEVDQERLVAILAELGQKGGMLRFVGKIALLWGGFRGAVSLTDRLISFLRIAERPLSQRILAFGFMVLVLWSPVVIPLLPALVQSWTMTTSNGLAVYACIIGLYVSVLILIMLWGKRIRGYDNPLEQYGLEFTPLRVNDFLKGLVGGMSMVIIVHSINGLLGILWLSRPSGLSSFSAGPLSLLKAYGSMLLLAVRGVVTAICIAVVEELLFRSWLAEEIATDLGYHHAVLISGIAFSLIHRSLPSIPGLLLLSLALFGIKQRSDNTISASMGVRTGIILTNVTLVNGGFIRYKAGTPFWLINSHPLHPFDSAVGLGICALLAIFVFPRHPQKKVSTLHQE